MKIARIRATPVLIPLEAPYVWSYGVLDGFTKCVVEVETTDGVVGIAEAPSAAAARLIDGFAPLLIGHDPLDIAGLERRILPSMPAAHSVTDYGLRAAWGAVEIALWDLRGRLWGQPIANLLGGIHRTRIPFTDYFGFRLPGDGVKGETTTQDIVDACLSLREAHGTTWFEGKISDPDLRANITLLTALRDALGADAMLRIDSNQAFSLPSAIQLAPAFQDLGVRNWEDPTPDWTQMRKLRTRTTIPFSGHNTDIAKSAAYGVPDAIVSDVAGLGAGLFSSDDLGCCCDWCSATTTLARRGFGLRMRGYFC